MTGAYRPRSPFLQWLEKRLPIGQLIYSEFVAYPTPRNLNYWWTFGAILSLMLGVQIKTRPPPNLTLVPPITAAVKPSRKLGNHGLSLWTKVTTE